MPASRVAKRWELGAAYPRHCERSEAIHLAATRKNGLPRRYAPLHKRFAFVAGNDVDRSEHGFAFSLSVVPALRRDP